MNITSYLISEQNITSNHFAVKTLDTVSTPIWAMRACKKGRGPT